MADVEKKVIPSAQGKVIPMDDNDFEVYHVPKPFFDELKALVKDNEPVPELLVQKACLMDEGIIDEKLKAKALAELEGDEEDEDAEDDICVLFGLKSDDMMIPTHLSEMNLKGATEYDDIVHYFEQNGARKTAEALVRMEKYYEGKTGDEKLEPITVAEWQKMSKEQEEKLRQLITEDLMETEEDEEESELEFDSDDDEDEGTDSQEPPTKKAKTG